MKKSKVSTPSSIQKSKIFDPNICFSFQHFDCSDEEVCPPTFQPFYTQTLMERLKALSAWTVKDFINSHNNPSIRAHTHDWSKTARPKGFQHLNEQLRGCPAWQFQLSQEEHGRVHGFFINHIFYIVWLDRDHKVYPSKK